MATTYLNWHEILNSAASDPARVVNRQAYVAAGSTEDRTVAIPETAPAYNAANSYVVGQFVTQTAVVYQCIQANNPGTPKTPGVDADYWETYTEGPTGTPVLPKRVAGDNVIPLPYACDTPIQAVAWLLNRIVEEQNLVPSANRPRVVTQNLFMSTAGVPTCRFTVDLPLSLAGTLFPDAVVEPTFPYS